VKAREGRQQNHSKEKKIGQKIQQKKEIFSL
jgi:hypothetical protein